jgi:hypothetical protein
MSADIFISFASQDAKIAQTICRAVESRGFKCWISTRDILPGENFQSSIVRAIRGAKVLLLVFTANSNRSDEMTKELALASQQKLMVLPLRVENITPSDAFAYEFATRQWIDLFADWEHAMANLGERLSAALADDRSLTDTIVLGKPMLRPPGVDSLLPRTPQGKRTVAVAAGVVVVGGLLGFGAAHLLARPEAVAPVAAAQPAAAEPAAASMAAVAQQVGVATGSVAPIAAPAEAAAVATTVAAVTAPPEPAAAAAAQLQETKPKPKPRPKPAASNLPY